MDLIDQLKPPTSLSPLQVEAIEAAKAGNWEPANVMELAFLNGGTKTAELIRWSVGHLVDQWYETNVKAVAIHRQFGPDGQIGVEWRAGEGCTFCGGTGEVALVGKKEQKKVQCDDCEGTGEGDDQDTVFSDIDGNGFPEGYAR